jgi:malate permease and related proteins
MPKADSRFNISAAAPPDSVSQGCRVDKVPEGGAYSVDRFPGIRRNMGFALVQDVFVNNLLPILLAAGAGFALGRTLNPDIRSASRLTFYIFSPCLVFTSLAHVEIAAGEFGKLALFTFSVSAAMAVLSFLCGKMLGAGRQLLASLIVASVFVNSGNYGLAANKFAFGEIGLARAMVCFVFSTVIMYTTGVLIASMGKLSPARALRNLLTVPAVYGLLAAGIVRWANLHIPLFVDRSVSLMSDAAIPVMLVILGLQIAQARVWPKDRMALIGAAAVLQLVVTPLVAMGMAHWIGLSGISRQAAILQSAMPAAVIATILAVEYELDTTLVTGTVVVTTLMSPFTLTPLIAYLLSS